MEHIGKLIGLLGLLACATLRAETTPLNQPLQEEQEITIACELTQAPKLHDDPVKRVRIQEGLKFATGMSGGARASSVFVQIRPGFTGLIMQGASAAEDDKGNYLIPGLKRNHELLYALTMGDTDSNKPEIAK